MRSFGILLTLGVLAIGNISANAALTYTDFSSVAGLTFNGNASQVGNTIQLTPADFFQSGSVFTTASTSLGSPFNSFSTHFRFQITDSGALGDEDGAGADGIVFVVQTQNNNAGGAGGGIGYQGITPSLGVEFDTFNNGEVSGNHVGIDLNGSVTSVTAVPGNILRFNNGQVWDAWVDYNGATNALEVRWSNTGTRPVLSQLSYTVDLVALLGQNDAYLGFTAGTGSGYGDQRILSWEYVDDFAPIGVAVPEPASMAIWSLGALGFAVAGYRRRRTA